MTRIGFIGLGHMGLPMAIHLINAGHQVTGFDLNTQALEQLANAGGAVTHHLSELAAEKDVFITMLQTGAQVQQVCLSAEGFYHSAQGSLHIDCSTIDVETTKMLHQKAGEQQLLMLEAPVSGGVSGAKAATLTFMAGGTKEAFEKAQPLLNIIGKKIYHTGGAGSGQAAKICNNMILGVSMIAISEAFILADKLGLAAQKLFEVVSHSSGQCWAMSHYVPVANVLPEVPANNHYQPGFTAAMMLKDLLLSQEATAKANLLTPLSAEACSIYQQFNNDGFGELDFSAIIKTLQQ